MVITGPNGIDEATVLKNVDGHQIILAAPLLYSHASEIRVIDGRRVDLRCEVALLTRNIVIQGDDSSLEESFGVITAVFLAGTYRMEDFEMRLVF